MRVRATTTIPWQDYMLEEFARVGCTNIWPPRGGSNDVLCDCVNAHAVNGLAFVKNATPLDTDPVGVVPIYAKLLEGGDGARLSRDQVTTLLDYIGWLGDRRSR
jgi:hypothetical protein